MNQRDESNINFMKHTTDIKIKDRTETNSE